MEEWTFRLGALQLCSLPGRGPFRTGEGQRRDRHLRDVHNRQLVWRCPYCPSKPSRRVDDLRECSGETLQSRREALPPSPAGKVGLRRRRGHARELRSSESSDEGEETSRELASRDSIRKPSSTLKAAKARPEQQHHPPQARRLRSSRALTTPTRKVRKTPTPETSSAAPLLSRNHQGLSSYTSHPLTGTPPTPGSTTPSPTCARVRARKSASPEAVTCTRASPLPGCHPRVPEALSTTSGF